MARLSEQQVREYRHEGYTLYHRQLFGLERLEKLTGIFEEHLAQKGSKLSDELDTPHFRDPRLLEFLLTPADFHALSPEPESPLEIFNVIFADDALSEDLQRLLFAQPLPYRISLDVAALACVEAEFRRLSTESREERIGYRDDGPAGVPDGAWEGGASGAGLRYRRR